MQTIGRISKLRKYILFSFSQIYYKMQYTERKKKIINILTSNQFLEDLDKLWKLRHYIPDPTKIEFSTTIN